MNIDIFPKPQMDQGDYALTDIIHDIAYIMRDADDILRTSPLSDKFKAAVHQAGVDYIHTLIRIYEARDVSNP